LIEEIKEGKKKIIFEIGSVLGELKIIDIIEDSDKSDLENNFSEKSENQLPVKNKNNKPDK